MKSSRKGRKTPIVINILSVSPNEDDHAFIRNSVHDQEALTHDGEYLWVLHVRHTVATGQMVLRKKRIAVILCDCDSMPGAYRAMLESLTRLPQPAPLIVTSRLADDKLWVEVLNLGAFDLLAKPFRASEIAWSINSAWLHWKNQYEPPAKTMTGQESVI